MTNKVENNAVSYAVVRPEHPYHRVPRSPWPFLASLGALWLTLGLVLYFHQYNRGGTVVVGGLLYLVYVAGRWWADVLHEGDVVGYRKPGVLEYEYTSKIQNGLYLGRIRFIVTEAMFFVGLLWAVVHAALMPTVQVFRSWPPVGIVPIEWTGRPMLNTVILATSFFTANAAKHALNNHNKNLCGIYLAITIGLGRLFSYYQYLEYSDAAFTFSDSVFGSTFYLSTGFHGMHVILGFLYLAVCLFQLKTMYPGRSLALDRALLYWHFVDLVWVFIRIIVYAWSGAGATQLSFSLPK